MKRLWKVHANGQERLGSFESRHSNALERIVENVNVNVSKTKATLFIEIFTDNVV
jgi:hypothetical protein